MDGTGAARPSHLATLALVAACCVAPMSLLVVLTTVAGLTIGLAAASILGAVAASLCIGVTAVRHRSHSPAPADESLKP